MTDLRATDQHDATVGHDDAAEMRDRWLLVRPGGLPVDRVVGAGSLAAMTYIAERAKARGDHLLCVSETFWRGERPRYFLRADR